MASLGYGVRFNFKMATWNWVFQVNFGKLIRNMRSVFISMWQHEIIFFRSVWGFWNEMKISFLLLSGNINILRQFGDAEFIFAYCHGVRLPPRPPKEGANPIFAPLLAKPYFRFIFLFYYLIDSFVTFPMKINDYSTNGVCGVGWGSKPCSDRLHQISNDHSRR